MKYVAFATYNPRGLPLWKCLAALVKAGPAGAGQELVADLGFPDIEPQDAEQQNYHGPDFLFDSFRDLINFFKGPNGDRNAMALKVYLNKRLKQGVRGHEFEKEVITITLTKRMQHYSYWPGKRVYVII
jgi:hypothetical protein